jgi:phage-related protein
MTSRLYDYVLNVSDTAPFYVSNNLIGQSSGSYGTIVDIDAAANNIKVKVNNVFQEYTVGESIVSNHYVIANVESIQYFEGDDTTSRFTLDATTQPRGNSIHELNIYITVNDNVTHAITNNWEYESANTGIHFFDYAIPETGANIMVRRETGNVSSESFEASWLSIGNTVSSTNASVVAIYNSNFIRSKNSFTQAPLVRLYTVYYPGEWYPSNDAGNPSGKGAGYAWPSTMPWRLAEVIGDVYSDLSYNVTFEGDSYTPYPMESDGINVSSDGTIDEITLKISNYDGLVTGILENPYIVGNVTSNSCQGYVNGEEVYGLDPRTVTGNAHYDQTVVDTFYGVANSPWLYTQATTEGETWGNLKYDSRDLLGAAIEIKSTFANHLLYWPEYSVVSSVSTNTMVMLSSAPYRIGDLISSNSNSTTRTVDLIDGDTLSLSAADNTTVSGDKVYINNLEYDPEAYVKDTFKVTELSLLNENFAELRLTNWLQYFKLQLPRRKFYKNTCQWEYKGSECQYPGPGGGDIPGTMPTKQANTNPITLNNAVGGSAADDQCSKSYQACKLRNNTLHFGGFPGTGRQIPRQ